MKIQIDTTSKTIKIENNIKLSELVKNLDRLFPNKEWKEFTLETHTNITHWSNPTIIREIERYPVPSYPRYPWYCSSSKSGAVLQNNAVGSFELKTGVYNAEIK